MLGMERKDPFLKILANPSVATADAKKGACNDDCRQAAEQVRQVRALHEAHLRAALQDVLPHLRGSPQPTPGQTFHPPYFFTPRLMLPPPYISLWSPLIYSSCSPWEPFPPTQSTARMHRAFAFCSDEEGAELRPFSSSSVRDSALKRGGREGL